jgi:hypothetical protein
MTTTTTIDREALVDEITEIRDEMETLQERFHALMRDVRTLPGGQHTWDRVDAYPGLHLDRDMGAGSNAIDWIEEVTRFLEEA